MFLPSYWSKLNCIIVIKHLQKLIHIHITTVLRLIINCNTFRSKYIRKGSQYRGFYNICLNFSASTRDRRRVQESWLLAGFVVNHLVKDRLSSKAHVNRVEETVVDMQSDTKAKVIPAPSILV